MRDESSIPFTCIAANDMLASEIAEEVFAIQTLIRDTCVDRFQKRKKEGREGKERKGNITVRLFFFNPRID